MARDKRLLADLLRCFDSPSAEHCECLREWPKPIVKDHVRLLEDDGRIVVGKPDSHLWPYYGPLSGASGIFWEPPWHRAYPKVRLTASGYDLLESLTGGKSGQADEINLPPAQLLAAIRGRQRAILERLWPATGSVGSATFNQLAVLWDEAPDDDAIVKTLGRLRDNLEKTRRIAAVTLAWNGGLVTLTIET